MDTPMTTDELDEARARAVARSMFGTEGRVDLAGLGWGDIWSGADHYAECCWKEWLPQARAIREADELRGLVTAKGFDAQPAPHPAVADLHPLVLYFKNGADAAEFVSAVQEALPGLVGVKVGEADHG